MKLVSELHPNQESSITRVVETASYETMTFEEFNRGLAELSRKIAARYLRMFLFSGGITARQADENVRHGRPVVNDGYRQIYR